MRRNYRKNNDHTIFKKLDTQEISIVCYTYPVRSSDQPVLDL